MNIHNRYITRGVAERIPSQLAVVLWDLLEQEKEKGIELDYLQIFELETTDTGKGTRVLKIVHRQEVPERESITYLDIFTDFEIKEKLYIILDEVEEIATMMLVEEY